DYNFVDFMTLEFIGRTEELAISKRAYRKGSSFVLLTGRRKIGTRVEGIQDHTRSIFGIRF
ncbi:MAG: hypothetical protein J6V08_05950, partial [Candidatus Methanomethylophilaceae archaeon]|nr:hypothetical protein [Candidatus Methanomethylophilaceae archaeon]